MRRPSAVLIILILATGCGSSLQSSAASVASARPSATSGPSSGAGAPVSWESVEGGRLPAGTYTFAYSSIAGSGSYPTLAFTFTLDSGWEKVGLEGLLWGDSGAKLGFAVPDNVFADPCDVGRGLVDPAPGPTIDEMTRALFEIPGWEASEWEWDSYMGFTGSHFRLAGPPNLDGCEEPVRLVRTPGWPGFVEYFGDPLEVWLLNVRGTRVLIYASRPADMTASDAAELQAVFDSIQITP